MNVMLIEPDQVLAAVVRTYLTDKGLTVHCASSAQAAIHILDEQSIDVIILEPCLARHNGIEFLYELRSYHDLSTIPLIIYSALPPAEFALSESAQNQLNIKEILYKPHTNLAGLFRKIHMLDVQLTQ